MGGVAHQIALEQYFGNRLRLVLVQTGRLQEVDGKLQEIAVAVLKNIHGIWLSGVWLVG